MNLQIIDLEGLANHRGSLLGSLGTQPTQRKFETLLHTTIRNLNPDRPIYVEAESNRIGTVYLPPALWQRLSGATVVEITLPISERVSLLLENYVHFIEDPDSLPRLLEPLGRLRGHAQLQLWKEQIAQRLWPDFVTSLLENHYDLCYRQPGSAKSNYQAAASHIALDDHSAGSYRKAAHSLSMAGASATP